MVWTLAVILFVLWVVGLSLKIAGGLIHIVLVFGVIVLLIGTPAAGECDRADAGQPND